MPYVFLILDASSENEGESHYPGVPASETPFSLFALHQK